MNIQSKRKQLFKNTGILAIGTLLSKVLSFFLLPIYTVYLSTKDYGYVDLLQTIATLLLPIISLELYCANFRFIIDDKESNDKDKIIATSFFINLITSLIFILIIIIVSLLFNFDNPLIFSFYFISLMVLTNLQFIIRGYGNNKLFSIMSFVTTTVALILNLLFIVILKYSAISILIAMSISNIISIVIILIRIPILTFIRISNFSKTMAKKLIKYSLPLIPNDISWWIANTSDRLIISKFLSLAANGIYAVANKIPIIYTTIFGVFNTAWVESVSRGINDNNSSEFINDMYKKSFKLFSCICLGIICSMSVIFNYFIGDNYSESYNHIFILTISIFFNSLSSIIGSILTGYKKTKIIGRTTIIGALINIIINFVFIKSIGLYAASISTLVSYVFIFIVRNYEMNKILKLEYPKKYFILLFFNLIIVTAGYIFQYKIINIILLIYLVFVSVIVNKSILLDIFSKNKDNK